MKGEANSGDLDLPSVLPGAGPAVPGQRHAVRAIPASRRATGPWPWLGAWDQRMTVSDAADTLTSTP
jgi:hypothetical protein